MGEERARAREVLASVVEQDEAQMPDYNRGKGAAYYIRDCQGQLIWAVTAMRAMQAFADEARLAERASVERLVMDHLERATDDDPGNAVCRSILTAIRKPHP